MSQLTEAELKFLLDLSRKPLQGIEENAQYWCLGQLEIAKTHPTFRVGYGASLTSGSKFYTRPFDVSGRKGIAVLFRPSDTAGELLAGWVQPEREAEANGWAATLNAEIKKRLDADDSYEEGVYDEAKAEFERTKHNKPSDLVARAKPKSAK